MAGMMNTSLLTSHTRWSFHTSPHSGSPHARQHRAVTAAGLQRFSASPTRRQVMAVTASLLIPWTSSSFVGACIDLEPSSEPMYDNYAKAYDSLDDGFMADIFGIPAMRRLLLAYAAGSVLEVGVGTGINLPLYNRGLVTSVTGVDLSQGMLDQATRRIESAGISHWANLQTGDVTALPFGDAEFDTVVDTFSLCVFRQPAEALAEMARMIRPNGRLLLLEHSRSGLPLLGWWQDVSASAVASSGKGCYWNQDVNRLVQQAGFKILRQQEFLAGTVRIVIAEKA